MSTQEIVPRHRNRKKRHPLLILLSILPVVVFYLLCQKHIIKGVAAGAVKG